MFRFWPGIRATAPFLGPRLLFYFRSAAGVTVPGRISGWLVCGSLWFGLALLPLVTWLLSFRPGLLPLVTWLLSLGLGLLPLVARLLSFRLGLLPLVTRLLSFRLGLLPLRRLGLLLIDRLFPPSRVVGVPASFIRLLAI